MSSVPVAWQLWILPTVIWREVIEEHLCHVGERLLRGTLGKLELVLGERKAAVDVCIKRQKRFRVRHLTMNPINGAVEGLAELALQRAVRVRSAATRSGSSRQPSSSQSR